MEHVYRTLLTRARQQAQAPLLVPLSVYLATISEISVESNEIAVASLSFRRDGGHVVISAERTPSSINDLVALIERIGNAGVYEIATSTRTTTARLTVDKDVHLLDVANRVLRGPPWYDRAIVTIRYDR